MCVGAPQIGCYFQVLYAKLAAEGIEPTEDQITTVHTFIAQAEQPRTLTGPVLSRRSRWIGAAGSSGHGE